MNGQCFRQFFVVMLFLALTAPAAEAAVKPPTVAVRSAPNVVVPADGLGIQQFLASGGRARIVQIAVVAMCIALFIMIRKING